MQNLVGIVSNVLIDVVGKQCTMIAPSNHYTFKFESGSTNSFGTISTVLTMELAKIRILIMSFSGVYYQFPHLSTYN